MIAIDFDQEGELLFNPLPECTFCGATEEVVLSNIGLMQIDHMILNNQIKTVKTSSKIRGK